MILALTNVVQENSKREMERSNNHAKDAERIADALTQVAKTTANAYKCSSGEENSKREMERSNNHTKVAERTANAFTKVAEGTANTLASSVGVTAAATAELPNKY